MGLISPHGGRLVDRLVPPEEAAALESKAAGLPRVTLNERETADVEMITVGAQFLPYTQAGEMIVQQWKDIGIDCQVKEMERNQAFGTTGQFYTQEDLREIAPSVALHNSRLWESQTGQVQARLRGAGWFGAHRVSSPGGASPIGTRPAN
mgnify:CR=1 FL=1